MVHAGKGQRTGRTAQPRLPGPDRPDRAPSIRPLREGLFCGLIVLVAASLSLVVVWVRASNAITSEVHDNLVHVAQLVACSLDGDVHQTFVSPDQEQGEAYRRVTTELRQVQQTVHNVKYVYTVVLLEGKVHFVLDSSLPGDADGDGVEDHASIMQPYDAPDPEMFTALRYGRTTTSKTPYTDRWGTFISAYAPFYDRAGQQVGVACVDMSIDQYRQQLASIRWMVLSGLGFVVGASIVVGGMVYLLRNRAKAGEELRQIFASVDEGVMIFDHDGTIIHLNPTACTMHGYSREELIGAPAERILHSDFHKSFAVVLSRLREGRRGQFEAASVHKNGTVFPVEGTNTGFWFRGKLHLLCSVRDITKRKRQEQALYVSEKRLELAIEGASLGLWDWNVQTGENYVSQRWMSMLGYAPEDIEPHIRAWESLLHPDDREPTMSLLRAHFDSESPYVAEFRLRAKSGDWVWICSRGKVVQYDTSGEPLRMLGIHLDVTNQKRAQLELAGAKEAAEAASRAKSNFLANMSHEIRTPMTAILGYLDVIARGCPRACEFSRIEVATYTDVVVRNANLLMQILNDILDLSRIEANKLQIERVACSPRQILTEVIELLKIRADAKELRLNLNCPEPIPETILSDPLRLRQILINLIGNAIKFTDSGEVRLVARLLASPDAEPQLEVRVIDSGIGMSPEQVGKLFQPFSQVDTSAARRFGGLGLGLVISRRLAMLLGGDITVESEPGKGSTFTLTVAAGCLKDIQLGERPKPQPPAEPEPSPSVSLSCRVLFAEDGPDNQRLIAYLLEKAGAEVTVAENGQVGLDCALAARDRGEPFDVILMDMQMPIMDGYEATRRLREHGWTGPIIALTAHAMKESREECLAAGCDDYLTKPIDRQALVQTVASHATRGAGTTVS